MNSAKPHPRQPAFWIALLLMGAVFLGQAAGCCGLGRTLARLLPAPSARLADCPLCHRKAAVPGEQARFQAPGTACCFVQGAAAAPRTGDGDGIAAPRAWAVVAYMLPGPAPAPCRASAHPATRPDPGGPPLYLSVLRLLI